MSDFTLYLDSVAFQEFEIPDSIKAGGAQALFKHKYPGGVRTIDTMGPDDDDITWSGTFMDGTAQDRCRQIDWMRRQGLPVVVTWAGYQYLVVIADFRFDFRRFWQVPYTITLAVIQDETYPAQTSAQDIDSQTLSDAMSAATDSGTITDSVSISPATSSSGSFLGGLVSNVAGGITSAVQDAVSAASGALSGALGAVSSALGSVPSLANATVSVQAGLSSRVASALDASQTLQSTLDMTMDAVGNPAAIASGTAPALMVASVQNLVNTSQALAANVSCSNTLGRMHINLGLLGK